MSYVQARFTNKDHLIQLNEKAIKAGYNRTIDPDYYDRIHPTARIPIYHAFLHNDNEMRCLFVINDEGEDVWLDMCLADWSSLDYVMVPEHIIGEYDVKIPAMH